MSTFDAANHYFSGQGVVMLGKKDPVTGLPTGLRPVGNVSDLKITVATTVIDHKGSQDGQRAIDKRLQTETKATASVTLENWISKNLSSALRGDDTNIPAGSVTSENVNGFPGMVSGFKHINVSGVTLKQGATTLVAYSDGVTPWDYKLNSNAGSIMLNDPSETGVAFSALTDAGTVPTGTTVGNQTLLTFSAFPSGYTPQPGERVVLSGFTGTNAAELNGAITDIVAVNGLQVTVGIDTTGATVAGGNALFLSAPLALVASYSYTAQYLVDSLTQPLSDSWIRFEGLNTVEGNSPVIVDIFRFSNDPLKELALISDTFGQFVLEGALLKDDTRLTGSKYFSVRKLS